MRKPSSIAFGAKTYYRPAEAAIRWAGLLRSERRILQALGQRALPGFDEFSRWPLLRLCIDRIFDGLRHGELARSRSGIVQEATQVALDDPDLTIRHIDLKAWVAHYYPGEKPSFLFDEIERALHPAINTQTLSVLLAEREAAKIELTELKQTHESLRAAHDDCLKRRGARVGGH